MLSLRSTASPAWRKLAWASLAALVLVVLLAYVGGLPKGLLRWRHADKVLHFFMVGSLAWWFVVLRGDRYWRAAGVAWPQAVLIPLLVAGTEEALQFFSPRRNADLLDLACDIGGLIMFWLLARYWFAPTRQRGTQADTNADARTESR